MKKTSTQLGLLAVSVSLIMASLPAHAVYLDRNLRDGLKFGISGSVNPSLSVNSSTFAYLGDSSVYGNNATLERMLQDQDRQDSDERARLNGFGGASVYLGAQKYLTRDITLFGNVGLYAPASKGQRAAYGYGVNLATKYGSIGINTDNEFSAGAGTPSGIYNLVDGSNEYSTAISVSTSYIPKFKFTAYHALPGSPDTRSVSSHENYYIQKAQGLSASYSHPISPNQTLSVGTAYSKSQRHKDFFSDTAYNNKTASTVGLSYRQGDWSISGNVGQAKENLHGAIIDDITTKAFGTRISYKVTPRISVSGTYGQKTTDKNTKPNKRLDIPNIIAQRGGNISSRVHESWFFDKTKQKTYGLSASYYIYGGISISASMNQTRTTNFTEEGAYSQRKNNSYRISTGFSF